MPCRAAEKLHENAQLPGGALHEAATGWCHRQPLVAGATDDIHVFSAAQVTASVRAVLHRAVRAEILADDHRVGVVGLAVEVQVVGAGADAVEGTPVVQVELVDAPVDVAVGRVRGCDASILSSFLESALNRLSCVWSRLCGGRYGEVRRFASTRSSAGIGAASSIWKNS
jgi:hypothetical protein